MKKTKKIIALSLLALVSTGILSGCDRGGKIINEDITYSDSVSLSFSKLDLLIGDIYKLQPRYLSNRDVSPVLSYVSSDPSVAKISEDGTLEALKPGTTKVTIIYGEATTSCEINVGMQDNVPLIRFDNVRSESIKLEKNSSLDLSAHVFFNSKIFDGNLTTKISSKDYGTFKNNIFTPNRVGKVKFTCSGNFFGTELEPLELDVEIVDTISFIVHKVGESQEVQSIALFNYETYGSHTYLHQFDFLCSITERGLNKKPTNVSLVDNDNEAVILEEIVAKEQYSVKVNGKKIGSAKIKISFVSNDGNTYEKFLPVTVDYSYVPYEGEDVEMFVVNDGFIDGEKIFASFEPEDRTITVVKSLDQKTIYPIDETGKVSGIEETWGEVQTLLVGNGLILKEVKFDTCSGIVRTAEDLEMFRMTDDVSCNYNNSSMLNFFSTKQMTGHYLLANDIDASGYTTKDRGRTTGNGRGQYTNFGFKGVFDGQGHTIKNLTINRGGIFNIIGTGAVIKNVGFENVKTMSPLATGEDRFVLASFINNAVIENVYIHLNEVGGSNANALLTHDVSLQTIIRNCLFIVDNTSGPNDRNVGYGAFTSFSTSFESLPGNNDDFLKNCYFVANMPLIKGQHFEVGEKFYYCDVEEVDFDLTDGQGLGKYPKYTLPNAKHYLSMTEFKNAGNSYSEFNSEMWEVNNGALTWKIN